MQIEKKACQGIYDRATITETWNITLFEVDGAYILIRYQSKFSASGTNYALAGR